VVADGVGVALAVASGVGDALSPGLQPRSDSKAAHPSGKMFDRTGVVISTSVGRLRGVAR
jgi:hypothetical protein